MNSHRISQREAYIIETLRYNGITNEEIMEKVSEKDTSFWKHFNPDFDFHDLVKLDEKDSQAFKEILTDGYTIKFVTFKGLRNLIRLRFHKVEGKDFQVKDKGIDSLLLNENQLETLKQMLSMNWEIAASQAGDQYNVTIELAQE